MRRHAKVFSDDITLLCPIVCGLNEMLKICNKYRLENNIILTVRKQFVLNLEVLLLKENLHFLTV